MPDIEEIIAAAETHASDSGEPGHEIGDLEEVARVAIDLLDEQTLKVFFGSDVVDTLLDTSDTPRPEHQPADVAAFLFQAAERHGSFDDPDHQVGDLQDVCREVWRLLSAGQRTELTSHPGVLENFRTGAPGIRPA